MDSVFIASFGCSSDGLHGTLLMQRNEVVILSQIREILSQTNVFNVSRYSRKARRENQQEIGVRQKKDL